MPGSDIAKDIEQQEVQKEDEEAQEEEEEEEEEDEEEESPEEESPKEASAPEEAGERKLGEQPEDAPKAEEPKPSGQPTELTSLLQPDEPGPPMARWLLLPVLFIIGHWCLLMFPDHVLSVFPRLWSPASRAPEAFLAPIPKTRVQVFDLGEKAHYFTEHCKGDASDKSCADILKEAAAILGADEPLTAKQLLGERAYLAELDDQRSVADRVMGFFSFVNVLWLVGITGIVCTVGPCIAVMIGPMLKDWAIMVIEDYLRPAAVHLHQIGAWEVLAYLSAFLLSLEGARYPPATDAGINVSLTGGMLFVPCWVYSTSLHMNVKGGDPDKFLLLSHCMVALIMAPLAIIHQSSLLGFLSILAVYGALGFIFAAFGFGFVIGFDSKDALNRCVFASVALILVFTSLRVIGITPAWVKPFVLGGMCLGNIMYFLALLIACGGYRSSHADWPKMQAIMAASLLTALAVGNVYAIPSMTNTACTFLVLWLMEKQMEIDWKGLGVIVVFLNCVALFMVSLWLNHHPEFIISMFDGKGLYT